MRTNQITYEELMEECTIDAIKGTIYWKRQNASQSRKMNVEAGYTSITGYRVLFVKRHLYKVHRLIWLAVHREFPEHQLDHIDNNRLNNSICNLRASNDALNSQNKRKRVDNTSGHTGVGPNPYSKTSPWVARVVVNRKVYAKTCKTYAQAVDTYLDLKRVHHPLTPWSQG